MATVGSTHAVSIAELWHAHPRVQPLPGGGIVVAGVRAAFHPDTGPERNATVVGPDGDVLAEGTLGDGIAHLLTAASGRIWVGYVDEGIFGNVGWGGPGRDPVGAPGPASALCTDGSRMVVASHRSGLTACVLDDTEARPTVRHDLTLPDGSPYPAGRSTVVGRGATLHLLTDEGDCYRLDPDHVPH